jgi:hypothetical protein
VRAKLVRPLDSLVVSDHAAYLGFTELMKTADLRLMATKGGREMVEGYQAGGEEAWLFVVSMMKEFDIGKPRLEDPGLTRSVWESVVDSASDYSAPGLFAAFNGYEWTSAPNGNNLHRNVIFRDGPERVKQIVPFSAFDSDQPEPLWEFLAGYERKTGGRVLAIPHNPNISNGVMLAETMSNGKRPGQVTAADRYGLLLRNSTLTDESGKPDTSTLEKTGHLYFGPTREPIESPIRTTSARAASTSSTRSRATCRARC